MGLNHKRKSWIANELKKQNGGDTATVGNGRGGDVEKSFKDKLKDIKKEFSKFARRTG